MYKNRFIKAVLIGIKNTKKVKLIFINVLLFIVWYGIFCIVIRLIDYLLSFLHIDAIFHMVAPGVII
jgi:hypothetical protein